jgi:hypothetical protein
MAPRRILPTDGELPFRDTLARAVSSKDQMSGSRPPPKSWTERFETMTLAASRPRD